MRHTLAVLGAGGFIGSRIVEMFHLESLAEVRPIARSVARLSGAARFDLDARVADAFDGTTLRDAFAGCDTVLHAVAGDRRTILGTLAPTYAAAEAAGVRRLVYLSSASVHGQAPRPGTDEETPLKTSHRVPYSNSRVLAERKLRALRASGRVEVVILRPGIVFGPRSQWTGGLADEILGGRSYLVGGGAGICNSIYIDNLAHAVFLAMSAEEADRHAFLVGDRETVTWNDLYRPVVEALGMEMSCIPCPEHAGQAPRPSRKLAERLLSEPIRRAFSRLPRPVVAGLRAAHRAWQEPTEEARRRPTTEALPFVVSEERALLHLCRYKLPSTKARALLGYEPIVSFPEGCRRSVGWLAFAGYPVAEKNR